MLRARAEATAATLQAGPDGGVPVRRHPRRPGARRRHLDLRRRRHASVERPPGSTAALDRRAAALAGRGAAGADTGDRRPGPAARAAGARRRPAGGHGRHQHVAGALPAGAAARARRGGRARRCCCWSSSTWCCGPTSRRALRPVQQMSAQAGRWSADDVDRRFGPRAAAGRARRAGRDPRRRAGPALGGAAARAAALRRAVATSCGRRWPASRRRSTGSAPAPRDAERRAATRARRSATRPREMREILETLMTTARSRRTRRRRAGARPRRVVGRGSSRAGQRGPTSTSSCAVPDGPGRRGRCAAAGARLLDRCSTTPSATPRAG